MDPRYAYKERDLVVVYKRMLHKTGMLAIGPYRFLKYRNNLGLVAEV